MKQKYLALMKDIAFRGGKIALNLMSERSYRLKEDNSILTKADTEISKLSNKILSDLLRTPAHILITEENSYNSNYFDQSDLKNAEFIWIIDPIDGTKPYFNNMPNFSISIGLLKELKPWLGVVYFPMLGELFYSDGKQSFFVQNASSKSEKRSIINKIDQQITDQSIFICNDLFLEKFDWDFSNCRLMNPSCSTMNLCWPTIGRGCGAFFSANLWDFAGSWPIFLSAGLSLRSYQTGKEITELDVGLFTRKSKEIWKLRESYLLSSKRNFSLLRKKIRLKIKR